MRERKVSKQISVKLSLEMTEYLEFILSIYTASNLLFKFETVGSFSTLQITGFCLGFLYSVLPVQLFIEKLFFLAAENESTTYDTAYPSFITTYSLANPVTATNARKMHDKRIKSMHSSSVEA